MNGRTSSSENMPNLPQDMVALAKELDSMPLEELKEEFDILFSDMDEESFDGELLEMYLDAIERKSSEAQQMDAGAPRDLDLKRDRERQGNGRRNFRSIIKVGVIAAAIVALMAASMAIASASGFDLFGKIARWTAETFGFSSRYTSDDDAEIPPQLQGLKEALRQYGIGAEHLPTYWPEGYEQMELTSAVGSKFNSITGTYGKSENYIVLTYIASLSESPEVTYNIDGQSLEFREHNGIKFHILTNTGKYLAVWNLNNVECRISGVETYEELTKILDSIGG